MKKKRSPFRNRQTIFLIALSVLILLAIAAYAVRFRSSVSTPSEVQKSEPVVQKNDLVAERNEQLFQSFVLSDFDNLKLEDLPGVVLGQGYVCGAALVGQSAWISSGCGRVLKYDLRGKLLGISDPMVAKNVRSILSTMKAVYLLDTQRGLLKADPETGVVTKQYFVEAQSNVDLWAGKKYVWVSALNRLWRINPQSDEVKEVDVKTLQYSNPLPSNIFISSLSNITYFSTPDNAKYPNEGIATYDEDQDRWGYIPHSQISAEYPKVNKYLNRTFRTVPDQSGWPSSYADINFFSDGVTTTVPTKLREYLAMARFDQDTYYLGSSAGIEKITRGALVPRIVAQVDPNTFPTGNGESHLLISPSKRYVTHLSIGIGLLGSIEIIGYDAVTFDFKTHYTTQTHAKAAGFEEFAPREIGFIEGKYAIQEKSDRLTVTLDGEKAFDIFPKK